MNGSFSTAKLSNGAVTGSKLGSAAVGMAKLAGSADKLSSYVFTGHGITTL